MAIYIRCNLCTSKADLKMDVTTCPSCKGKISKTPNRQYRVVASFPTGRKTKMVASKKNAEKIDHAWKEEIELLKAGVTPTLPPKEEVEAPVLKYIWAYYYKSTCKGLNKKQSFKKDRHKWKYFIGPTIGNLQMDQIKRRHIASILDNMATTNSRLKKPYALSTIRQTLMLIKGLYTWAYNEELYTGKNPTTNIKDIKVNNEKDCCLEAEEAAILLSYLEEYDNTYPFQAKIIALALLTGRRKNEIITMEWKNVSFKKNELIFPETKNDEKVLLPLCAKAIDVLKKQKKITGREQYVFQANSHKRMHNSVDYHWKKIKRELGLPSEIRFHDLRHTFASIYMSTSGGNIYILKELLGHKTLKMTERYTHLKKGAKERALSVIEKKIVDSIPEGAPIQSSN